MKNIQRRSPRAALLAAMALFVSCGSAPRPAGPTAPTEPEGAVSANARMAAPAKKAAPATKVPAARQAPPAPPSSPYLEAALSQYSSRTLPNGLVLSVKRQPGRAAAAARIALVPAPYPERMAGLPALALACAAKGALGAAEGSLEGALYRAGAELELRIDGYDDVALELLCPLGTLEPALELVAKSLAAPAFLQADFDRVLGEFRVAERRESGDPAIRAASLLRSEAYRGHPYAVPPRGTASSLALIGRDDVMRFWAEGAGAQRLRVSVVGDVDPDELARRLAPSLGELSRRGPDPARPAKLPLRSLAIAEAFPASAGKAFVRAEFGAPDSSSPGFAALAVALAMLDDLLALGSPGGASPLGYSAWTRLSAAAAGSASLCIQDCPDPEAARAAFADAAALLASGRCLDARNPGALGDIGSSLEIYRLRAVAKTYAKADGSADLAARVTRDLASGGDGTGFFRMADRIAAVSAAEVARVAKERLVEGPSAWIALGDPKVIAGFAQWQEPR